MMLGPGLSSFGELGLHGVEQIPIDDAQVLDRLDRPGVLRVRPDDMPARRWVHHLGSPTDDQLARVDGSRDRFDDEIRPALMPEVVEQMQDAGVEADVWKVEGLDRPDDDAAVSAMARRDGREDVGCVVLGRGASLAKVADWLRAGAGVPGYVGFAVGRSIWTHALTEHLDGRMERDVAVDEIGANYAGLVETWREGVASAE